ncbi:hypothetical protein [Planomonospora parontospora]|uniref:hypothetical protein n=1 Tax=Planomonospora parontospora TaxID=58119 RepID=UPI0016707A9C|nr:hypothetical protein [Planomonospora parontospora]GGL38473.1 hypothetical protein GCM10014719_44530 [Planomonospora parontospora subsp. antibiotica]GII17657.1 hypothetical protein Ppa05_43830 [Planomonospora parontospora subsp. antibiotica]
MTLDESGHSSAVWQMISEIMTIVVVLGIAGLAMPVLSVVVLVVLAVLALTTGREQDGNGTFRR